MKKIIAVLSLIVVIATLSFFVGCGSSETYTVTFDANGGTLAGSGTVAVEDGGTIADAPTASYDGYIFGGWSLEKIGGDAINLATYTVSENVTLYAQWTEAPPDTYAIKFDANGGTLVGEGTVAVERGGKITGAPTASLEGYKIKGWFFSKTGGSPINFETYVPSMDMTLYAQWEDDTSTEFELSFPATSKVTFAGGALTATLNKNDPMPEYVNGTGRTILGWYDVANHDNTWVNDEFSMPARPIGVAPYVEKLSGYRDIVPCSEQNTKKPANLSNGLSLDNFIADSSKGNINDIIVCGGENEYAETGKLVRYDGKMANGEHFRINTTVATTEVVVRNVDHTFRYNFENKGTEVIDLMVYQINSGVVIEPGDLGHRVYLMPNESMTIEFTMKLTSGTNNKNALTLMKINATDGMEGMMLGMSMSIKLGSS